MSSPKGDYNEILSDQYADILTQGLPVGITIMDAKARCVFVNNALCKRLNISPDEWLGKTSEQLVNEGYLNKSIVYQAIETRQQVAGIIRSWNGVESLSICRPIFNKKGDLTFIVASAIILQEALKIKEHCEKKNPYKSTKLGSEIEFLRSMILGGQDLIFTSDKMARLAENIKKIAPLDCTVLITGESGVGKEVVAKIIHKNSERRDKPFIPVTIPSIPQNLIESELFGYEEGAFSGSSRKGKVGLLELAHGGTLFLDEVGDIPYPVQVKLLRAIETNEILRVGGVNPIKLDIRIIAATNKDLDKMVEDKLFREDLYYRLKVVPLTITPLRERPEDIAILATYYLNQLNYKHNLDKDFSPCAYEALKEYHWPGNVRELKNLIERIIILSNSKIIYEKDVRAVVSITNQPRRDEISLIDEYEHHESNQILDALKKAKGNKTKAAELLGISRTKLYSKLRKYQDNIN